MISSVLRRNSGGIRYFYSVGSIREPSFEYVSFFLDSGKRPDLPSRYLSSQNLHSRAAVFERDGDEIRLLQIEMMVYAIVRVVAITDCNVIGTFVQDSCLCLSIVCHQI